MTRAEKQTVIIPESEWDESIYKTKDWENTVTILNWEHDYVKKQYTIIFQEL